MSTYQKKPLTGILPGGTGGNNDDIFDLFERTEAADDFGPLPRGVYIALAASGRLDTAQTGTRRYKVEFRVIEGEYTGRRLWWDKYLTEAAMLYTKRDLAKLGIDSPAKLREPFPANRLVCKLTVVLRKDKDGIEHNEIRDVEVIRTQDPQADPFAPPTPPTPPTGGSDGNPDFPFGANGGPSS